MSTYSFVFQLYIWVCCRCFCMLFSHLEKPSNNSINQSLRLVEWSWGFHRGFVFVFFVMIFLLAFWHILAKTGPYKIQNTCRRPVKAPIKSKAQVEGQWRPLQNHKHIDHWRPLQNRKHRSKLGWPITIVDLCLWVCSSLHWLSTLVKDFVEAPIPHQGMPHQTEQYHGMVFKTIKNIEKPAE